jgi:AcrR family transcriptional regulator
VANGGTVRTVRNAKRTTVSRATDPGWTRPLQAVPGENYQLTVHKLSWAAMAGRPRTISDDEILAATARAISAVGPGELTLAHVAREAGIAAATVVQRFGSKRALLLAFTARAADGVEADFAAARDGQASPLKALVSRLVAMSAGLRTAEELSRHLAFLQLELADPEFREHTLRHALALRAQIRALLDAAVAAGELAPSDTERLAAAVYVTYNGALISWAILRQGALRTHVRRELEFLLEPYAAPT